MKSKFLPKIIGVMLVLICLTGFAGCGAGPLAEEKVTGKDYSIEQLSPGVIRIVAFKVNTSQGDVPTKMFGYGDSFAMAVKEVGKQYIIHNLTPIVYSHSTGAATKELLLIVAPK